MNELLTSLWKNSFLFCTKLSNKEAIRTSVLTSFDENNTCADEILHTLSPIFPVSLKENMFRSLLVSTKIKHIPGLIRHAVKH